MINIFKRFALLWAVVVTVVLCMSFTSAALNCDGYEYRLLDNGCVEIIDYEGSAEEVRVPCEIEGKKVTSVADGAFDDRPEIKLIYLPVTLEYMGDTFYNCSGLAVCYMGDIYQWMKVDGWEKVSDYFNVVTQPHICTELVIKGKAPTCTEKGLSDGKLCTACSVMTQKQTEIPATGHSYSDSCDKSCNTCGASRNVSHTYKTVTTKATLKKNGKQVTKCTVCGYIKSSKTVYYPKSVKLSTSTYTYNGKTKTPSVVVKDSKGNTLKKDTDYTVKYASGRKNPGKYTVTVTFKGKYSGTKKLTLTIKPKAPSITDIYSKTKGKAVVKWANVTGESGYELYYASSKDGTYKKVNSYKANKLAGSKTKLKSGKKYYFKVRAYKKTSSGTVYSSWSAVKSVKIK